MGSELDTKSKPGLEFNRHITGYCIGTKPIVEATLVRNGKDFKSLEVKEGIVEFEIDDMQPLSSIALEPNKERPPFAYYYLRVSQEDGHIAWSSPIWVDVVAKVSTVNSVKKLKKKVVDTED